MLICFLGPYVLQPSLSHPRLKPPLRRPVREALNRSAPLLLKVMYMNGFYTMKKMPLAL